MHYYPHYIDDFNAATRHLTRLERSIYRDLIDTYYDTEKPLRNDLRALGRKIIANSDEELAALEIILNEYFILTDEGWRHERCETVIAEYAKKVESAKSAAAKRWQNMRTQYERNTDAMLSKTKTKSKTKSKSIFKPPTNAEVAIKAKEKGAKEPMVLADRFVNYYESNGWKVGKNQMKSWQHALGNWIAKEDVPHETHNRNKTTTRSDRSDDALRRYVQD